MIPVGMTNAFINEFANIHPGLVRTIDKFDLHFILIINKPTDKSKYCSRIDTSGTQAMTSR